MVGKDRLDDWLDQSGVELLDSLTGAAPDVVGVLDRNFIIRYVNWTAPGLTREQVIGFTVFNLIPPGYTEVARRAFERALLNGESTSFETHVPLEDSIRVFSVRVGPVRDQGEIVGAFTLNTDVTEQRRELIDRDRFFSLSGDLLAVMTPDGALKRVNPEFVRLLGDANHEGRSAFTDFVHSEDADPTREHLRAIQKSEHPASLENRCADREGAVHTISWRCTFDPITNAIYAVGRDVTDQRSLELRLRHALKMEAVGQLAGGIAHDFNNLMQAILANVDLAFAAGSVPEQVGEHLRDIEEAGRRAAELTKQLLMFSRRQSLHKKPIDLGLLLQGTMKFLERLLPKSIAIDLRLEPSLPPVSADQTQMEQVLMNLCVNARDAMEAGGRLTIETALVTLSQQDCDLHPWAIPGRFIQLSVTDTGSGMSDEVRQRIFEPFFTTKENHRGTGLGLATVHGIIEQHGGLVHVYSEPGEGTTFKLYLPTDDRAIALDPPDRKSFPSSTGLGATILVAEDDERVRRPLLKLLEAAGYQTLAAEDGREAIRMVHEHPSGVDLVLLDLVMPEMGGAEAVAQILSENPQMPVLFASGYADERFRERLPEGAEVLEKPFRAQDLLLRIQRKLDSK